MGDVSENGLEKVCSNQSKDSSPVCYPPPREWEQIRKCHSQRAYLSDKGDFHLVVFTVG